MLKNDAMDVMESMFACHSIASPGGTRLLKTFKSRKNHQVDLYIPDRGNPSVTIKGPAGDSADIHFEWFEQEKAAKVAEMIAEGFSARETSTPDRPRHER